MTRLVVLEAANGMKDLEILRIKQVDLILSDINMPLMDGLEFVRQIVDQNLAAGCSGGHDHDRVE